MKKRRWYFAIIIVLCGLILLWFSGLLPKQVAKIVANNYMAKQEDYNAYEFKAIEYSSAHDSYFASYNLKEDTEEGRWLEIPNKYFPLLVFKDSSDFKED